MTFEILTLEEFGDIVEYVKKFVENCDWSLVLKEADLVEFNDADYQICTKGQTPSKQLDPPTSIWKKMIGYRSIFR